MKNYKLIAEKMKKYLVIIMSICFFVSCNRTTVNNDVEKTEIEDTVFLFKEQRVYTYTGNTHVVRTAVYIAPDTSLNYYRKAICDFGLGKDFYIYSKDGRDGRKYIINLNNRFYKYNEESELKEVSLKLKKKKIPQNLPKIWIPLYPYNNEYYLYRPCEFVVQKYNITDTLLIDYSGMDGIYGFPYDTIVQKSKNHYIIQKIKGFHSTKINIHIIDRERGIAVFEFDNYKPRLYVDVEKVKYFSVIVHDCNEKEDDYKFPDIDLRELIKKTQE